MNRLHQLKTFLTSVIASSLILHAAGVSADDTEVFFGGPAIDANIKPNVFFILDNSGSMAWRLDTDSTPTRTSHGPARMTVLKEAFSEILNTTSGVNIGVMALNSRSDFYQDRLVYPVEFIDDAIGLSSVAPEIIVSADDATRQTTSPTSTITDSTTLVMGNVQAPGAGTIIRDLSEPNTQNYSNNNSSYYLKSGYTCSVKIGTDRDYCDSGVKTRLNAKSGSGGETGIFLFRNINIPKGVTITSATLSITPETTMTTKPGVVVRLESNKTPAALNDATLLDGRNYLSTGNLSSNSTKLIGSWTANTQFNIDLTTEVRNLQNITPITDPVGDILLDFRSTTNNNYYYHTGDTALSPKLTITYTGTESAERTTGLRFQNVAIPKGATITSARLDFVAAASDDRPVTFEVSAQNTGNAAVFSATEDFTGRSATSAVTWTPQEWRTENPPAYLEGPSLVSQVQQVVNNSAWCGNNAMAFFVKPVSGSGSRTTYSVDGSNLKPVLRVTYTGGENGCLQPVLEARVIQGKNDARQTVSESCSRNNCTTTYPVSVNENTLSLGNSVIAAARYESLPIKRNAQVLEAQVIFTRSGSSGSSNTTIYIENAANSSELQASNNNLGSRSVYAGLSCALSGERTTCSGAALNNALQNVFAKSDWTDGNAISLLLQTNGSSNNYTTHAFDGSPTQAIKLRMKLSNGSLGTNSKTVKQHVDGLVQQMNASGGTPIVPALYDAARYLSEKSGSSGVFGVDSPIDSACQPTHLVLLTDGKPEGTSTAATNGIPTLTGGSCSTGGIGYADELCGRELVRWMANEDQSSFEGDNFITTHTVGFALNARPAAEAQQIQTFLRDLAREGKGSFYTADNASDLANSFNQIIQEVLATDTTFVTASAAVNTFNRQDNKDEVYFSLFRPSDTDRWPGNLKRYRMVASNGQLSLVDADNTPAIDENSGFFKSNARSFWSASADGSNTAAGGAASKLPELASRRLLTNVANNSNTLSSIELGNAALTQEKLGVSNATDRANLISYIRGADSTVATQHRKAIGDPLHSTPTLITYACNSFNAQRICEDEDQSAIIGTNEGFVHLFNTSTGAEEFAFMPDVLLPNIKQLRENTKTTSQKPRTYGMDNTVTVWVNDANGNGVISGGVNPADRDGALISGQNEGEFIYAYATMGRGGSDIYALDITNRTSPTLLWKIQGGSTPGFERLGQTWSAPVRTKMNVGGAITDVLVFGGGYDPNQDDVDIRTADARGNALYVVNARTGSLIWSASSAPGHTSTVSQMQYGIPSKVSVIGLQPDENGNAIVDPDGLAGQIFVGDMGGQVWRFYVNNGSSGSGLVTPAGNGVFASVGGTTPQSARRFYHEVELSFIKVNGVRRLSVNVGSGYRGHPLNEVIQDRFYSFRTHLVKGMSTDTTLTESVLFDATSNAAQTSAEVSQQVATNANGWMIRFPRSGEKVLSRPLIADGLVLFSTYQPQSNPELCRASVGISRAYTVRLGDATGLSLDRFVESKASSLPSNPQMYCVGNACYIYHDPSELVLKDEGGEDDGGDQNICAANSNPEKCRCDLNPNCIWMPTTPKLYWIDEE